MLDLHWRSYHPGTVQFQPGSFCHLVQDGRVQGEGDSRHLDTGLLVRYFLGQKNLRTGDNFGSVVS